MDPRNVPLDTPMISLDVHDDGVLWCVNKAIFHPRGFALAHTPGTDEWFILGDGSEPWHYGPGIDDECFAAVERLFARAKENNADRS